MKNNKLDSFTRFICACVICILVILLIIIIGRIGNACRQCAFEEEATEQGYVKIEETTNCDVLYEQTVRSTDDNLISLISSANRVNVIDTGTMLVEKNLPKDIDYSYFQSYMSYQMVTDKTSPAYDVINMGTYIDTEGMLRKPTGGFKINNQDDYVIALASYYTDYEITKDGTGIRYLVITSTGAYTAITGDEKDDVNTDPTSMYTPCGKYAGLIEWIVDPTKLDKNVLTMGTMTAGPNPIIQGEILHIYRIYE